MATCPHGAAGRPAVGPGLAQAASAAATYLHYKASIQPVSNQCRIANFATWRQGLHRQLAKDAVIEPPLLERLDAAWGQARSAFESTGANSLQFISFIERQFPYEFNLLVSPHLSSTLVPHGASGVK